MIQRGIRAHCRAGQLGSVWLMLWPCWIVYDDDELPEIVLLNSKVCTAALCLFVWQWFQSAGTRMRVIKTQWPKNKETLIIRVKQTYAHLPKTTQSFTHSCSTKHKRCPHPANRHINTAVCPCAQVLKKYQPANKEVLVSMLPLQAQSHTHTHTHTHTPRS